jgi:hypothetical protein
MSKVLTPIVVQPIDGRRWLVKEEYRCVSNRLGLIVIPVGFVTDFNSDPQALWNLLPPTDYPEAALPHDLLYQRGALNGVKVSREDADSVHQEFVAWAGSDNDPASTDPVSPRQPAPKWKRDAYHGGLRWFGWIAWNRYRRADAKKAAAA